MREMTFDEIRDGGIAATRSAMSIKEADRCNCSITGKIVGVDFDVAQITKNTFVQFIPDGKKEACVLRIAAFHNHEQIVKFLNEEFFGIEAEKPRLPENNHVVDLSDPGAFRRKVNITADRVKKDMRPRTVR